MVIPRMRSLALLALLPLMLALAIGGLHVVGEGVLSPTDPLQIDPGGHPCRAPCLFGVIPGQTSAREAADLLRGHPLLRGFDLTGSDPFRLEGRDEGWIMQVSFNQTPASVVDEITVARFPRYSHAAGDRAMTLPEIGSLSDALLRYGQPDFVQLTRGGDPMLVFSDQGVLVSLNRARGQPTGVSLWQPVGRLTVFARVQCAGNAFRYAFLPWLGVSSYRHYGFVASVSRWVRPMASMGATFAPCIP